MKTLVKTICTLSLLTVLSLACKHDNEVALKPQDTTKTQTNQAEYQRLIGARATATGTSFDISEVIRSENLLLVKVKGGCSADDYTVVWDGMVLLTYPQIVNLVIANPKDINTCASPGEHTLTIDLKKLIGDTYNPNDFQVQVSNGSKIQDKLVDKNGVVSNK